VEDPQSQPPGAGPTKRASGFQLSYWDAAILEAARSLGCAVVLSEDLSDGQDYDGVRVENPFR
jgi:predicted nucleic acid-binding protein